MNAAYHAAPVFWSDAVQCCSCYIYIYTIITGVVIFPVAVCSGYRVPTLYSVGDMIDFSFSIYLGLHMNIGIVVCTELRGIVLCMNFVA